MQEHPELDKDISLARPAKVLCKKLSKKKISMQEKYILLTILFPRI
jgi:hypothetical protein